MAGFGTLLRRELVLAWRQPGDAATVLAFFVLAAVLFPFGVGPAPNLLAQMAAGIVWVTALLAAMLSLERLFQADLEDGSLDLLALLPSPLWVAVAAKIAAHWLTTGLPLLVVAPAVALLFNLADAAYPVLLAALALGTPAISLIGAVGAGLTLGARRGGVLLALLVLPLLIPVLILGAAAVDAVLAGLSPRPHLLLLAGLLLAALVLCPWAATASVRQALD
ncbi:MAG: heme exporter protein CcmB [Alphaproteobacteria bacterium]|nr:heme exporter protein CcmB [Alphaproteobacteria bacterium]